MLDGELESANDDFVLQENLYDTVFAVLASVGAMSIFVAALFYSF